MPMINGDFNVKTDSGYPQYKDEIGKYGKKLKNSNDDALLELAKEKKLILANTMFNQKIAH